MVQSCLLACQDRKVDNTKNSKDNKIDSSKITSDMSVDLENDKLVNLNDCWCRSIILKLYFIYD